MGITSHVFVRCWRT